MINMEKLIKEILVNKSSRNEASMKEFAAANTESNIPWTAPLQ